MLKAEPQRVASTTYTLNKQSNILAGAPRSWKQRQILATHLLSNPTSHGPTTEISKYCTLQGALFVDRSIAWACGCLIPPIKEPSALQLNSGHFLYRIPASANIHQKPCKCKFKHSIRPSGSRAVESCQPLWGAESLREKGRLL